MERDNDIKEIYDSIYRKVYDITHKKIKVTKIDDSEKFKKKYETLETVIKDGFNGDFVNIHDSFKKINPDIYDPKKKYETAFNAAGYFLKYIDFCLKGRSRGLKQMDKEEYSGTMESLALIGNDAKKLYSILGELAGKDTENFIFDYKRRSGFAKRKRPLPRSKQEKE